MLMLMQSITLIKFFNLVQEESPKGISGCTFDEGHFTTISLVHVDMMNTYIIQKGDTKG
jgi:hypothetical protein